ncbi:MAG TPA: hypothetical protein VNO52_16530 [Methylomirabilota bacterium]|nr:hypothetical protein [Methylomirabilota bacterium]
MAYALLQQELLPPEVEQLKRAFSVWPALTEIDAHTVARDAFGILLKGLELEQANLLQASLRKEAIETVVIKESDLPAIPAARVIKQVEFLPTHLTMFDPIRRKIELPWTDILLIGAGNVRLQEMRRIKTSHGEPQVRAVGVVQDNPGVSRPKEEARFHYVLEIFTADAAARYSLTADDFDFDCLGARVSANLEDNFATLVGAIEEYAPHASLNQGAYLICKESRPPFKYPSKAAFWEELTWMLWRIAEANKAEAVRSPDATGS